VQIAFFDSGIGGLTVLHQARRQMPREDFLYYADTDHVPYGRKTKEEIRQCVRRFYRAAGCEGAGGGL